MDDKRPPIPTAFRDLSAEVHALLLERASILEFSPGDTLQVQGESASLALFVIEGVAQTWVRSVEHGIRLRGRVVGPGDDLGLAETLAGAPYAEGAVATEALRAFTLSGGHLQAAARSSPELGERLRLLLATRLSRPCPEPALLDLASLEPEETAIALMPRHLVQKYRAMPLCRHRGALVVGFVDPNDLAVVDDVRRLLAGLPLRPVALDAPSFDAFWRARPGGGPERLPLDAGPSDRLLRAVQKKTFEVRILEATSPSEERARAVPGEQVVILLNRLIGEAMELGASDIHIEPAENELVVRYRVDGLLCRRPGFLDSRFHAGLVSRLKALAQMDIADRRRAQDGRLDLQHGNKIVELRLSTVPTRHGEKVVIRILDPTSVLMEVEKLVPVEKAQKAFRWMIEQPQGIVIFSGPTGSGKTTTIYSAMIQLRKEAVNIVTIEDPVEYVLDGVTQVQVNEAAGVSFANSVRHFLRQDPDILLVGETRDRATAATAIEASLTGHLVLTSLHANDALGAIVRLREMGIEPFLLAHSLIGVVNQRLVRRICAHCREQAVWHPDLIRPMRLFTPEEEGEGGFVFHRGRGCPHCNDQGFKGRIGVFEMLRVSDTLRPSIASGAPSSVMEVEALRHGLLLPLREYCRHLLRAGLTTPEEIARVLFTEA